MRRFRAANPLTAVAFLVPALAAAQTAPPLEFHEFTLANGLRFIVQEDPSVPVVAVNVWYDVGRAQDPPGRSGFAHLFEHMLFQETENIPLGRFMEIVPEAGGVFDGTTADDRTNYFSVLPSNRLNLALWMEAERLGRLVVSEENFVREREVVKEERRMRIDNQPYTEAISITLDTLSTDWPPYSRPGIGSMEDLDAADIEDVRAFHRQFYNPNNATVAVVGDVSVEEVRRFAEQYFGGIPRGPDPPPMPPLPEVPRTSGERRAVVEDRLANTPLYAASFGTAPAGHADTPALRLLSAIFSQGESSRLHQRLVRRERAAVFVQSLFAERVGPGSLLFFALPNQGVDAERLEALVDDEIRRLIEHGVDALELEKAKNQMVSSMVSQRQTVMGRAEQLQTFRLYHGDPGRINTILDDIMAVNVEDVRRVARTYLTPENRTVVIVRPASPAADGSASAQGR